MEDYNSTLRQFVIWDCKVLENCKISLFWIVVIPCVSISMSVDIRPSYLISF